MSSSPSSSFSSSKAVHTRQDLDSVVWLAHRATALLVAVCFLGLPMFWLNLANLIAKLNQSTAQLQQQEGGWEENMAMEMPWHCEEQSRGHWQEDPWARLTAL